MSVSAALMTMHPELVWRRVQWSHAEAVTQRDQPRARLEDAYYPARPVAVVRRTKRALRVPLSGDDLPFSICLA